MTTEHRDSPEYIPIGFDVAPSAPHGNPTTILVMPTDMATREIRGIRLYHRPGEIEVLRLSYYESWSRDSKNLLDSKNLIDSAVGPFDAADYNVELEDVDSVQEKDAPRFCRVHWGLVSQHRPVTMTISAKHGFDGNFKGVLYSRRVISADPIGTIVSWKDHPEFRRFLQLSFEMLPPDPTCELMYYGWVGRDRAGV